MIYLVDHIHLMVEMLDYFYHQNYLQNHLMVEMLDCFFHHNRYLLNQVNVQNLFVRLKYQTSIFLG